jgi:hypothetical protein
MKCNSEIASWPTCSRASQLQLRGGSCKKQSDHLTQKGLALDTHMRVASSVEWSDCSKQLLPRNCNSEAF